MNTPRVAITGGTSGLGLALVRELRRRGARVAFVARNREGVERVMREVPRTHGIVGDVARKDDIYPIALQLNAALGGLDVLVNTASSLGPTPLALLADTECEDFALALETNVLRPFRLTKALLCALTCSARQGRCSARGPRPPAKAAAQSCSTYRAMRRSTPTRSGAPMARRRRRCAT